MKGDPPINLKISPVTVIPQPDQRGHIILDLLFPVYRRAARGRRRQIRKIMQEAVKKLSVGLAPEKAVKQLGKILPRLFEYLLDAPAATPLLFSKIDLSDGFWRMKVLEDQKWNFSYVMPEKEGERTRIVVPSALQMGWCQSPSFFCTATEAANEVTTRARETKHKFGPSQMEHFTEPAEPVEYTPCPTDILQVFVDDFILATQPELPEYLKELS